MCKILLYNLNRLTYKLLVNKNPLMKSRSKNHQPQDRKMSLSSRANFARCKVCINLPGNTVFLICVYMSRGTPLNYQNSRDVTDRCCRVEPTPFCVSLPFPLDNLCKEKKGSFFFSCSFRKSDSRHTPIIAASCVTFPAYFLVFEFQL